MKRSLTHLAALVLAVAAFVPAAALATSQTGGRAATHQTAEAYTHGNLPADWWKWALAQPPEKSPLFDSTGANCAEGQQGHVWYLAGAFEAGPINRACTIPAHTALFFPVVNLGYFGFETDPPDQRTKQFVLTQLAPMAGATAEGRIDGVLVPGLVRVTTLFKLKLKADNLFGQPRGFALDPSGDSGYYVTVDPLPPGQHTIHLTGAIPALGYSLDVTYTLTVEGNGHSH